MTTFGLEAPVSNPENPGPIIGAGSRDIAEGSLNAPNMRSALIGWNRPISFELVTITIKDSVAQEVRRQISTTGTLQPMMARKIMLKSEGQRAWNWFTLHTVSDIQLKVDDRVIRKGVPYRVMGSWGWEDNGFFKYELVQDYADART